MPLELWQLIFKSVPVTRSYLDARAAMGLLSNFSLVNKHWSYWAFECLHSLPNLQGSSHRLIRYLTIYPHRIKQRYRNLRNIRFLPEAYSVEFGDTELAFIAKRFHYVQRLDTCNQPNYSKQISDDGLVQIAKLQHLVYLDLTSITVSDLSPLGNLAQLKTLILNYAAYTYENKPPITGLVSLKKLSIRFNPIQVDPWWGQLTSIQHINRGYEVNSLVGTAKNYPNLTALSLKATDEITAADWAAQLPRLSDLQGLHIGGCRNIRVPQLVELIAAHLPKLRKLSIYPFSDHGMPAWYLLTSLRDLRKLSVAYVPRKEQTAFACLKGVKIEFKGMGFDD